MRRITAKIWQEEIRIVAKKQSRRCECPNEGGTGTLIQRHFMRGTKNKEGN